MTFLTSARAVNNSEASVVVRASIVMLTWRYGFCKNEFKARYTGSIWGGVRSTKERSVAEKARQFCIGSCIEEHSSWESNRPHRGSKSEAEPRTSRFEAPSRPYHVATVYFNGKIGLWEPLIMLTDFPVKFKGGNAFLVDTGRLRTSNL